MSEAYRSYYLWVVASVASWGISWVFGFWFAQSSIAKQTLPHGLAAIVVAVLVGILMISSLQWIALQDTNYVLWLLATGTGVIIGLTGGYLAFGLVFLVPESVELSLPAFPSLGRPLAALITTFLGAAPAGVVSGPLQKIASHRGRVLVWIPLSMLAWGLAFGVAALLLVILSGEFQSGLGFIPTLASGSAGGLAFGAVLGLYLYGTDKNTQEQVH